MISSRKNGFPSARSRIDSRRSAGRSSTASSTSTRGVASSSDSGSRTIELKLRWPPPQPGRRCVSSGREGQTNSSGPCDAVRELLEQVEHRGVGPVDVLDDDDGRTRPRRGPRRTPATPRGVSTPHLARSGGRRSAESWSSSPTVNASDRGRTCGIGEPAASTSLSERRRSWRAQPRADRSRARRRDALRISRERPVGEASPYGRQRPAAPDGVGLRVRPLEQLRARRLFPTPGSP